MPRQQHFPSSLSPPSAILRLRPDKVLDFPLLLMPSSTSQSHNKSSPPLFFSISEFFTDHTLKPSSEAQLYSQLSSFQVFRFSQLEVFRLSLCCS